MSFKTRYFSYLLDKNKNFDIDKDLFRSIHSFVYKYKCTIIQAIASPIILFSNNKHNSKKKMCITKLKQHIKKNLLAQSLGLNCSNTMDILTL